MSSYKKKITVPAIDAQNEMMNLNNYISTHFSFDGKDHVPDLHLLITQANNLFEPFKKRFLTSSFIPASDFILNRLQQLEWNLDKSCRFDDEEYNLVSRIWEAFRERDTLLQGSGTTAFNFENLFKKFLTNNNTVIKNLDPQIIQKAKSKKKTQSILDIPTIIQKYQINEDNPDTMLAKIVFCHCFELLNALNTLELIQDISQLEKKSLPLRENNPTYPILTFKLDKFLSCPFSLFANETYHEAGFIHSNAIYQKSFKKYL